MILTRRFGALAARRTFPAVTETQDAELRTQSVEQNADVVYTETSTAA